MGFYCNRLWQSFDINSLEFWSIAPEVVTNLNSKSEIATSLWDTIAMVAADFFYFNFVSFVEFIKSIIIKMNFVFYGKYDWQG